jgi:hypothetical protein
VLAVVGIFVAMFFWRLLVLTGAAVFERAGLVPSAAAFEARSALTGVGYTTSEAEVVVNDPASRQAVSLLMIVGFVGPVTILGLFGFGFFLPTSSNFEARALLLALLIALFVLLERFGVNGRLLRPPARVLARTLFRAKPGLMWTVIADHAVAAVRISPSSPMGNRPLGAQPFGDPAVTVLGIKRVGSSGRLHYVANPLPGEEIMPGDELILYGPEAILVSVRDGAA